MLFLPVAASMAHTKYPYWRKACGRFWRCGCSVRFCWALWLLDPANSFCLNLQVLANIKNDLSDIVPIFHALMSPPSLFEWEDAIENRRDDTFLEQGPDFRFQFPCQMSLEFDASWAKG